MPNEKNFENRIKRYLVTLGIYALGTPRNKMKKRPIGYYEKRWGGGMFTKSGLPDLHIVACGKSIDVEIKAENGKPSDLQLFMLNQIRDCGGIGLIVYPNDFEHFKEFIEGIVRDEI